jgi:hypothetical protein
MDLPRRVFASPMPAFHRWPGDRVTKSAAGSGTTPEALITYPEPDLQGDRVDPAGIDWSDFESVHERLVNFEHRQPIGTAEVEYKVVPRLNKAGQPDDTLGEIALPFGVTTFFKSYADAENHTLRKYDPATGKLDGTYDADECYRLSQELAPLVPSVFSGVSFEFQPVSGWYKSLGKSELLKNRDAFHFIKSRAIGYAAACELPVNKFAGYVQASDEVMARAEKALRLCDTATTSDIIRKAARPLADVLNLKPNNRVTGRGATMTKTAPKRVNKAGMYDDEPGADVTPPVDAAPVDTPPPEDAAPTAPDMKPTPASLFQLAQGIEDACAAAEQMGESGEHPQGLKDLAKLCEAGRAVAAKAKAAAEKVAASQGGEEMAEEAPDAEPEPVETDDDTGVMKSQAFDGIQWRPDRLVKASGNPYPAALVRKAKVIPPGQTLVDKDELAALQTIAAAYAELKGE